MSRRAKKASILDDLAELPWWISIIFSVIIYVFLKYIFPAIAESSPILKSMSAVFASMAVYIAAVFLFPACKSFLRSLKKQDKSPSLRFKKTTKLDQRKSVKAKEPTVSGKFIDPSFLQLPQEDNEDDKPVEWSEHLLKKIEWKRFEELCSAYFEMKGYISKGTGSGADGGVDIKLYKADSDKPVVLVQCKAWNKKKIGVETVRAFFGVMSAEKVYKGAVMATGDFTDDAKVFAKQNKIVLATGSSLYRQIIQLPKENREGLLKLATDGDYMTPTCASCEVKMVLRTIKKGRNAGNHMWGCMNYPRCKSKIYV